MGGKPTKFILEGTSGLWDVPTCSASWSLPLSGNPHIILSHSSWFKLTGLSSFLPHGSCSLCSALLAHFRSSGHHLGTPNRPDAPVRTSSSTTINFFNVFFFFLNDHTENICMKSRVFLVTETVADPKFLPSRPLGTLGLLHLLAGAFVPGIHSL